MSPQPRERVTITLRQDLLRALDRSIDGQRIRNRSHAVEMSLARTLDIDAKQALILASGRGVKMRPFTYEIPKPLIPVQGKPLLEHGITLLARHGIRDITITVSYLADRIMKHFGDGSKFNVNITYVKERRPTGTGGALRAARPKLQQAPFILLYGDVLLDVDLTEFMQSHQDTAAIGTIALTSVPDPSAYGAVRLRGNRIVEFSEKPDAADTRASRLVFAGCGIFNPPVFAYLKKSGRLSLEQDVFPRLIKENLLLGYPFEGQWFDVSTPKTYEHVLKEWRR
ncbi:MAG: hypothetical protein COT71_00285 [Candidatus Andersenbacteria bacterium CG10_big_fil_rev_8_21_14_0_10_54_11]|uniref:Nucleotidyl transferase domain-containing protein n=1 Tax=Candidatus Andersenbacteria bacterium CG10_big_fil_rev_8_21_14_0_10_54_11 TaxID=1974485 RepID=A0A2M6X0D4_9BACT|nr:MAG: hypothetical protein COT71_00285 [Candidatus Andersenbacteria bacterium CG10_big_fil_rev_8_21_14_0_10_54_11]